MWNIAPDQICEQVACVCQTFVLLYIYLYCIGILKYFVYLFMSTKLLFKSTLLMFLENLFTCIHSCFFFCLWCVNVLRMMFNLNTKQKLSLKLYIIKNCATQTTEIFVTKKNRLMKETNYLFCYSSGQTRIIRHIK